PILGHDALDLALVGDLPCAALHAPWASKASSRTTLIPQSRLLPTVFEWAAAGCPKKPRSSSTHRHMHSDRGTRTDFAGGQPGALKFPSHAVPQHATRSKLTPVFFIVHASSATTQREKYR